MLERLEKLDQELFLFLNGLHVDWLDPIMIGLSNPLYSIPVYIVAFFLIQTKFGWKVALWSILAVSLVVFLADGISTRIFKEGFKRYRPCHNAEISSYIHLLKEGCGGLYTFVSGHATNFFALATFFIWLLKDHIRLIVPVLMLWAALIAYSRIYLGVHYPVDILSGALLGIFIGWLVHRFFKNIIVTFNMAKE
ncbi:MAG: phosphatase PAP2 family protein [Flavobacteriales bacterium]|nr:phosphatase PAP2 family protein [Flavobacteriales bacterium]